MTQPQSDAEIAPIVARLRELDPLLSIRWNPTSRMVQPPHFDATGKPYAPKYEGRWEVMREQGHGLEPGIVYVVRFDGSAGLTNDGRPVDDTYRPVGWWLVEYMQRWDAAQRHFLEERARAWKEHEEAEAAAIAMDDAANQEFMDKFYHTVKGRYWIGRGFTPELPPQ